MSVRACNMKWLMPRIASPGMSASTISSFAPILIIDNSAATISHACAAMSAGVMRAANAPALRAMPMTGSIHRHCRGDANLMATTSPTNTAVAWAMALMILQRVTERSRRCSNSPRIKSKAAALANRMTGAMRANAQVSSLPGRRICGTTIAAAPHKANWPAPSNCAERNAKPHPTKVRPRPAAQYEA